MELKFAQIQYANSQDEIPIHGLFRKMPQKIRDFYIEKKNPYTIREMEVLGAEGFEICLPVTLEEALENHTKNEIIVKNTLSDLNEYGVEIIIPPQGILFSNQVRHAEGKIIFAFFLIKTVNRLLKSLGRERKDAEFLLIDGGNFLTDLVLDCLYPEVNFLSVFTDRVQKMEEKGEEIYQEYGLNVPVFSNSKNSFLREADVIINCGMDLENYDYLFKKRSIYLDVNQNRAKIRRLMAKREDMFFLDGIQLKRENCYLSAELMESVEFIQNSNFRHFLTRQYHPASQKSLAKYFQESGCKITGFYCNGKRIPENKFFRI